MLIVCVKWGNQFGPEYVNILHDMIRRNTTKDYQFVCYTDDPTGLDCETRELPKELEGWWGKLYLFKELNGKTLFFDLDTLITNNIDDLLGYEGDFAILRDFYRQDGLQSAIMAWNGDHSYIWDNWNESGCPKTPGGDQTWIETQIKNPDIIQNIYPGIVSYKAHCIPYPPRDSRVICFHGLPRPHHKPASWVEAVWRIGGMNGPKFESVCNTGTETLISQIRKNTARSLPEIDIADEHKKKMLLVGGGPSLKETFGNIRFRWANGQHIYTTNNTHDFLIDKGIIPHAHVMLDAREENAEFVKRPHKDIIYYIASQCHPKVFEQLEGYNVVIWHDHNEALLPLFRELMPKHLIGGGGTVGLKTFYLGYMLGYRKFHVYGMDSCYNNENHHAYEQTLNDGQEIHLVHAGDRTFYCAAWMIQQAEDYQVQAKKLLELGCGITVHGDGLIHHISQIAHRSKHYASV